MTKYEQPQTVGTDALATLGTIIDETCGRDAIHLAVENVKAGELLYPGQHVSLANGTAFASVGGKRVGIVDPFLPGPVGTGQRFWLVVYPRQITSLRHVWEHPDFPPSDTPRVEPAPAAPEPEPAADKVNRALSGVRKRLAAERKPAHTPDPASVAWMKEWAGRYMASDMYGIGAQAALDGAYDRAIEAGHNHSVGPWQGAADHIDGDWWYHWERITGKPGNREEYFSCSC